MHELACPSCNSPSQFDFRDHFLLCPVCSSTFHFDAETGQKDIFSDHFIVPNTADAREVKSLCHEWLKRLHHRPGAADREFYVTDIKGVSLPYWVVSMEGHTMWKGLVSRKFRNRLETHSGAEYLVQHGQFRRSYRWALSARKNLCEYWGLTRLHQPQEDIHVEWDGFPLDSTFSRGRLREPIANERSAYDIREFFEFKFANGLPISGIQIDEDEALRRAKNHVDLYHYKLSKLNVDFLVDHKTEHEVAGIQLIHLPFWHARYVYKPKTALKHFYQPREKNVLVDGYGKGILNGELAIVHRDKVLVNAVVCAAASVLLFLLGAAWHPAFFLVALFAIVVAAFSAFIAASRKTKITPDQDLVHGGLSQHKEGLPTQSGAVA